MKIFLESYNIVLYSAQNKQRSAIVQKFIRTISVMIFGDVAYYKSNIVQRVSKFLPPPPDYKAGLTKVKVQLDLINYATESDVKFISQHLSELLTSLDERQI